MNFLILFQLFLVFSLVYPSCSRSCNPKDKQTLLQIKKAFNNPTILSSWNPTTPCCSWHGVECYSQTNKHRVTSLKIYSAKFAAQIPPQIGDLTFIDTLQLMSLPNLYGTIPRDLAKLKHLKILFLTGTSLSGSLPDFLSDLKSLTFLDLTYNKFTGPIPSSLSRMPKLEAIQLTGNQLTGSIPESFGSFVGNLPNLYLGHNNLSGTIPASFAKLDFNGIDLSSNKFTGDPSILFGSKKTTSIISLSNNKFSFDISNVKFPQSLYGIQLNGNHITGRIPTQLAALKRLSYFDISHNQITGRIPNALSALQNLKFFDISHNQITGEIPSGIAELKKLESFDVSHNRLCGRIPAGGNMVFFNSSSYTQNLCLCGAPLATCKGKTL